MHMYIKNTAYKVDGRLIISFTNCVCWSHKVMVLKVHS